MIKMTKKLEYSLIALKHMAGLPPTRPVSAREICDQFSTPFDTTSKVLQLLSQGKVLQSIQGIRGGYILKCDLKSVSFLDLVEIVDGHKARGNYCMQTSGKMCDLYPSCNIIGPVELLQNRLGEFLENLNLYDLLIPSQLTTVKDAHEHSGPA